MPMIESFRDLDVWRKSMDLAVKVYITTETFPRTEALGLTSQLRRAAVSIPSNIAEGKSVGGQRYRRHIKIALGSNAELQTQIDLAKRLGILNDTHATQLMERASEIGRMLAGLFKALPKNRLVG
jgi:four helix bundle protein